MPAQVNEREYLSADGKRYRMVPKGTANHCPAYLEQQELIRQRAELEKRQRKLETTGDKHKLAKAAPKDVVAKAYEYALAVPTIEDISAMFEIASSTFVRWRKDNPEIDVAITKARTRKTQSMIHVVEKKAQDPSDDQCLRAVGMWMQYFRKDLSAEKQPVQNNVQLNVAIIPPAQDASEWLANRGEAHLLTESQQMQDHGVPVFKGRPTNG